MPTAVVVAAPLVTPYHPPVAKASTPAARPLDVLVSSDGVSFPIDRQVLSSQR